MSLVTKTVETVSTLVAKAVETQGKGSVLSREVPKPESVLAGEWCHNPR